MAVSVEFEREALVHLDAVHRFARRLCADETEAQDLVNDCFMQAFRHFDQYRPGTNCRSWLFRILYNEFRMKLRRGKSRPQESSLDDMEEFQLHRRIRSVEPRSEEQPEKAFFDQLPSEEVRRAISDLEEEFRSVLLLSDVHEMTYQEIAEVLQIPIGTVRSRLARARERLRRQLWKWYHGTYGMGGSGSVTPGCLKPAP